MSAQLLAGLRLLVVEDEAMIAMALEDLLGSLGCVVVDVAGTVSRGVALANCTSLTIDGAILDVNLGGEKVYPVAESLAARGVPFVFCTGYGPGGLAKGFDHVPTLAKPYEPQQLEDLLISTMIDPSPYRPPGGGAP